MIAFSRSRQGAPAGVPLWLPAPRLVIIRSPMSTNKSESSNHTAAEPHRVRSVDRRWILAYLVVAGFAAWGMFGFVSCAALHLATFFVLLPELTANEVRFVGLSVFALSPFSFVVAGIVMRWEFDRKSWWMMLERLPRSFRWLTPGLGLLAAALECLPRSFRWLTFVIFLYAVFNFSFVTLYLNHGGDPSRIDGRYVLENHGHVMQVLTKAEYQQHQTYLLRLESGHMMAIYWGLTLPFVLCLASFVPKG